MTRPGLTEYESQAYDALTERGWVVARSGWPDFLVYDPKTGRAFGLEWKVGHDVVRPAQERMHLMFQSYFGIDVLVTGSVEEAVSFQPRDPIWLATNQQRRNIERLQREGARLDRAINLLRAELVDLEAEWRKLKAVRDEHQERVRRVRARLTTLERVHMLRLSESTTQDSTD